MDASDAARLIRSAVEPGGRWADLGAGAGTFTTALALLLGARGTVHAVERDAAQASRLAEVASRARAAGLARVEVSRADFTRPLALHGLDGLLLANALHYVPDDDQARVLGDLGLTLRPHAPMVIVEYEDRPRSRWVPYPIPLARLESLARDAALGTVRAIGTRRSSFGGAMYAAVIAR